MDSRLRTRIVNHRMSAVNIDVAALCPDEDMEETAIIRLICPPVGCGPPQEPFWRKCR